MRPPRFNGAHRAQLRHLGVIDSQLVAVERVLPLCRSLWSDAAPLAAVRNELQLVASALNRAHDRLRALETSERPPVRRARREAFYRFHLALDAAGIGLDIGNSLDILRDAIRRALADLPTSQRRPNSAEPQVVQHVDEALRHGWANRERPVPQRYPHVPSSGLNSPFRRIVGICYEAFTGCSDLDPERAIKYHLRRLKTPGPPRRIKVVVGRS